MSASRAAPTTAADRGVLQARLARLRNDWKGKGQTGQRFLEETHPYAADLDLFGPGSLFELLCTAHAQRRGNAGGLAARPGGTRRNTSTPGRFVAELRPLLDLHSRSWPCSERRSAAAPTHGPGRVGATPSRS